MAEYKNDPYAVLRPELANRASALLGEILSVIRKRTSDKEAVEPHNRCTEESAEGYYNVTQKLYELNPKNLKRKIQLVSRHDF
jgi:hypothetical protein